MTPQNARRVLGTFLVLSLGVGINIMMMQPVGFRGSMTRAGKPERRPEVEPAGKSPPVAAAVVASGDSPEVITAIQRELAARDYDLGASDGIASAATRAAIMAWEHDNRLPLTGEPTAAGLKAIILGVEPGTAAQISAELRLRPANQAVRAQQLIRSVQQSLADLGYTVGVTGEMGDETARAIREFEQEQALPQSGRISSTLVTRLATTAKSSTAKSK
jgi:peptidoglycan hydrolase-like protein with peptidoglycan-binding domain